MEIVCSQCRAHFRIPDNKIPEGQNILLTCPKCKNRIPIDRRQLQQVLQDVQAKSVDPFPDQFINEIYDSADRPFDFIAPGAHTALICEPNEEVRSSLSAELMALGYYPVMPQTCDEALKRMRFHMFNVIVLNDRFGCTQPEAHPILYALRNLAMETRRTIFVILLTDRFRSMDDMAAFHQSVNLIINDRNVSEFTMIFQRAIADHEAFYRVFLECLSKLGKS